MSVNQAAIMPKIAVYPKFCSSMAPQAANSLQLQQRIYKIRSLEMPVVPQITGWHAN